MFLCIAIESGGVASVVGGHKVAPISNDSVMSFLNIGRSPSSTGLQTKYGSNYNKHWSTKNNNDVIDEEIIFK